MGSAVLPRRIHRRNATKRRRQRGGRDATKRWHDAATMMRRCDDASGIGRWLSVDPLAENYPSWSPYNYVLNNPVGMVDPDGKAPNEIIDPTGKKVSITRRSDGVLSFSSNATPTIIKVANAMNETRTGREQLKQMIQTDIKIEIELDPSTKQSIINKPNGGRRVSTVNGETIQGNFSKKDNYGRFITPDGKFSIKVAKIILYEGSIRYSISDTKSDLYGLSESQGLGAVAAHESVHASDKSEIHSDILLEQTKGKVRTNREVKPEKIEKKVVNESKEKKQ